jgi:hypothetical protein
MPTLENKYTSTGIGFFFFLSYSGDERHGYSIWPGIAWWLTNPRPGLN